MVFDLRDVEYGKETELDLCRVYTVFERQRDRSGDRLLTSCTIAWFRAWNFECRAVFSSLLPGADTRRRGSGSKYLELKRIRALTWSA